MRNLKNPSRKGRMAFQKWRSMPDWRTEEKKGKKSGGVAADWKGKRKSSRSENGKKEGEGAQLMEEATVSQDKMILGKKKEISNPLESAYKKKRNTNTWAEKNGGWWRLR